MRKFRAAAKRQIEKLQRFQSKQLRRFVQATRYSRNDIIHKDLKIEPMFPFIKKRFIEASKMPKMIRWITLVNISVDHMVVNGPGPSCPGLMISLQKKAVRASLNVSFWN